jgi:hypothetical protein
MKKTISLLIICLLLFDNCNKDDLNIRNDNPEFDPTIAVESIVKLNSNEIGGSGLVLVTAKDENSPLSKSSFNTVVSKEGEQFLINISCPFRAPGLCVCHHPTGAARWIN